MSTKELAYSMIDRLNEEQLDALVVILKGLFHEPKESNSSDVDSVMGILHEYADPSKVPLEKEVWADAAAEHEKEFWEELNDEVA